MQRAELWTVGLGACFVSAAALVLSGLSPALAVTNAGGGTSSSAALAAGAPIPSSGIQVKLKQVASGLAAPLTGVAAPGDGSGLYVGDQVGLIYRVDLTKPEARPRVFADIRSEIGGPLGCYDWGYDERGLLGLAFSPHYKTDGKVYAFVATAPTGCDAIGWTPSLLPNHRNVVLEWRVDKPGSAKASIVSSSRRVVLAMDNPYYNHSGGGLQFGPDGLLYVGVGDGGASDGQNPEPYTSCDTLEPACTALLAAGQSAGGNSQDPAKLSGKILRIDPAGNNGPGGGYGIPRDNPFVGTPGARPEIWALGLRNPFAFSFIGTSVVAADPGEHSFEELNFITRGGSNFGWPVKEGSWLFAPDGPSSRDNDEWLGVDGEAVSDSPGVPSTLVDPAFQYGRSDGIAIVGGYAYKGSRAQALKGSYVFGDYARDDVTYGPGRLFVRSASGAVGELQVVGGSVGINIMGFGRDARGDLYVMGNPGTGPGGTSGVVYRIETS